MHESAFDKFQVFVDTYLAPYKGRPLQVLDVGSRVIGNGSACHRPTIQANGWTYTGLDIEPGDNVDLVVADGDDWHDVADDSYDLVLCSQVLEHARSPWRVVQEAARVLRPRGLAFLIAPSAGHVHRFPEDCFRYYPDGLPALAAAAGLAVVEAHVQERLVYSSNLWLDAMLVAQKPSRSPEAASRERARLALARLALRSQLGPQDLAGINFSPRAADPSLIGDLTGSAPRQVFAARDAALAKKLAPTRRLGEARRRFSQAVKILTRPL